MNPHFTPEQEERLQHELLADESLLWAGQPTPLRTLRGAGFSGAAGAAFVLLIILGILFMAFGRMFMPLFSLPALGIPSLILGVAVLIMLASIGKSLLSPVWQVVNARQTLYAITDRRILILEGIFVQQATSYGPDDVERLERRTYGQQGYGDIIFRRETRGQRVHTQGGFQDTRPYEKAVGFFGIPEVRLVEQIIFDTFLADPSRRTVIKRKHQDSLADREDDFLPDYDYGTALADLLPGIDPDEEQNLP